MSAGTTAGRDPHLTEIEGDGEERVMALQWAGYLSAAFGPSGALDALRLYVELGWISDGVRQTMTDYVRGLAGEEGTADVDDELPAELEGLADTPFHRHAKSLEYVATIGNENLSHVLAAAPIDGGPSLDAPGE